MAVLYSAMGQTHESVGSAIRVWMGGQGRVVVWERASVPAGACCKPPARLRVAESPPVPACLPRTSTFAVFPSSASLSQTSVLLSSKPSGQGRPLRTAMRNPFHAGPPSSLTIVIKLGTSSIIHPETHQPLLSLLSSIVETICALRAQGHRVVLVSSGAIGVGMKRMGVRERGKGLAGKQVRKAASKGGRGEGVDSGPADCLWLARLEMLTLQFPTAGARCHRPGPAHRPMGQPLFAAVAADRPDPAHPGRHFGSDALPQRRQHADRAAEHGRRADRQRERHDLGLGTSAFHTRSSEPKL